MTFLVAPPGRENRLGASEISALLIGADGSRLDKSFSTPWQVWARRHLPGFDASPDARVVRAGNILEPALVAWAAEQAGATADRSLAAFDGPWASDDRWPSLGAHPDGIAGDAVVEAKTSRSADGWGEDGSAEIPAGYLVQVQAQLAICGADLGLVPALVAGDLRLYRVAFDPAILAILDAAQEWAARHIVGAEEPPIDLSAACVRARWPEARSGLREATAEEIALASDLARAKAARKVAEGEEERIQAALCAAIGDAEGIAWGRSKATWKAPMPTSRLDLDALLSDRPDLADAIESHRVPVAASRRFLLSTKE